MTITAVSELGKSSRSKYIDFVISKASLANTTAGGHYSLWTTAGLPAPGAAPGTTPIVPTNLTTGSIPIVNRTAPAKNYISELDFSAAVSLTTIEIHDRLLTVSGLNGTLTTLQTITGMDLNSFLATSNLDQRKGDANYSDVQWWVEWYTATGATASNMTINALFNDGTSGNLVVAALGANFGRLGRFFSINSLIGAADQGKFIRGINSVQLSASTGTAGNFGFTATRYRCHAMARTANMLNKRNWDVIGFPEIFESSALFPVVLVGNSTSSGVVQANGKLVYG